MKFIDGNLEWINTVEIGQWFEFGKPQMANPYLNTTALPSIIAHMHTSLVKEQKQWMGVMRRNMELCARMVIQ